MTTYLHRCANPAEIGLAAISGKSPVLLNAISTPCCGFHWGHTGKIVELILLFGFCVMVKSEKDCPNALVKARLGKPGSPGKRLCTRDKNFNQQPVTKGEGALTWENSMAYRRCDMQEGWRIRPTQHIEYINDFAWISETHLESSSSQSV